MEEIKKIKNDFELGFITPHEFLNKLTEILFMVGAAGELEDTINDTLLPLANFIKDEVLNASGCTKKQIKDFLKKEA